MSEQVATASTTLAPGAGEVVSSPIGARIVVKVRGAQSEGAMTVFESEVPPGAGPPLHLHEGYDECMYVLAGDLRVRVGDEDEGAQTGSFAFFGRGVAHCWQNVGAETARILVVVTPAGLEELFERFTAPRRPAGRGAGVRRARAGGRRAGGRAAAGPVPSAVLSAWLTARGQLETGSACDRCAGGLRRGAAGDL